MRALRRLRVAVGALLGVALVAALLAIATGTTVDDVLVRVGVRDHLAWSDEFDGPAGSAPDPDVWTAQTGATGWGNRELQDYTDDPANVALDGTGNLVIRALATDDGYTSARITTKGKVARAYGRIEARIKVPVGAGLLPAFWMTGDGGETWPANGEIDVMEVVGDQPHQVRGNVHGPGYAKGADLGGVSSVDGQPSLGDAFHTYAIDWSPGRISWSIDGLRYKTVTRTNVAEGTWVFDHPFSFLLNVAVGGNWPGDPTSDTAFPAEMVVQYLRVYDR